MKKLLFLLLLVVVTTAPAHAKQYLFEEYGCAVTIPDLRWTIDTSESEPGLILYAYMENQSREVFLFVSDPPPDADLITDPGLMDSMIAGVTGEGEFVGKEVRTYNRRVFYEACFSRMERQHKAGTSYHFLIRNGYLYTLVSRGRYTDPCNDRGFQTIARSLVVGDPYGFYRDDRERMGNDAPASYDIGEEHEGPYTSEGFAEQMEEFTTAANNRRVIFAVTMLIVVIGFPAYIVYYWLMRRKRLMRESDFETQLATAPELELARVILNRQEYSIDAVDIAERELTRHGRREAMLKDARLRQEAGFDDEGSGLLLGDAVIRRRIIRGTVAGVISGAVVLSTIIQRVLSGAAANDPNLVILSIVAWALVCLALSYGLYQRRIGAAIGLVPTLIFLPLWTSVDTGTLSLLPLLLLAIPAIQAIRAVEDDMKKRVQGIDMATVGWEG